MMPSLRDGGEGGGPQGIGGSGYGCGWTSAAGCNMATIIGKQSTEDGHSFYTMCPCWARDPCSVHAVGTHGQRLARREHSVSAP